MKILANTVEEYIEKLPEERLMVIRKLLQVFRENIPKGFEETISYNMIGWVVPHSVYPDGYHATPELPLPFINLASQKHFVAVYHSGIYAVKNLADWFIGEYPKYCKYKLDMGKSCIRFKKMDDIPYELIGRLATKLTVEKWISIYETNIRKRK